MRGAWGSRWCFILKRRHLDGRRGSTPEDLAHRTLLAVRVSCDLREQAGVGRRSLRRGDEGCGRPMWDGWESRRTAVGGTGLKERAVGPDQAVERTGGAGQAG
jgi:hypothetical protein